MLDRLAAPAVATERSRFLLFELQPLHHLQDPADGKEIAVVGGGRANQNGFGTEYLGDDIVLVPLCGVHQLDPYGGVCLPDAVGNGLRHFARRVPHGVRPVEHRGLDKDQPAAAEVEGVAGLDGDEIPFRMMIMSLNDLFAVRRAVDRGVRDLAHQLGQRAAVVDIVVVHHDIINLFQVDFLFEPGDELLIERLPHRVDQDGLPIPHEIGL